MINIAVDTETYSLTDRRLLGVSIAYKLPTSKVFYKYYPIKHSGVKTYSISQLKKLFASFSKLNPTYIFHNAGFDLPVLYKHGINLLPYPIHDTMIIAHLLDERQSKGLKKLAKKYLNFEMTEYKNLIGKGKNKREFWETGTEGIKYASEDALATLMLFEKLYPKLQEKSKLYDLYQNVERPLLYTIAKMHSYGIYIDTNKVNDIENYCLSNMELIKKKLDLYIPDVNINSSQQLVKYFIEEKHLPVIKHTPKGSPAVDREVLEEYAQIDVVAKLILDYRKFYKIYTTFIPAFKNNYNGWIYPSFNQVGTKSGRLSSSNPNFQNIPTDDEFGLRECVIASRGHKLIGADYSQMQLRILAIVSKDRNLIQVYNEGGDLHTATAEKLGIERRLAKTVNFATIFGVTAKTLSRRLNIPYEKAQLLLENFYSAYPQVKEWIIATDMFIENYGYTETLFGRRRRVSYNFYNLDNYEKYHELRALRNHIIQGTEADIIKIAMAKIDKAISSFGACIIATIHDEILIDCPEENVEEVMEIVKQIMEDFHFIVPIVADVKSGYSWKEVH